MVSETIFYMLRMVNIGKVTPMPPYYPCAASGGIHGHGWTVSSVTFLTFPTIYSLIPY